MNFLNKKNIYFIVGPTASGKTETSLKLAGVLEKTSHFYREPKKCEIISCDSRQIFKDLNISTGKVTEEEKGSFVHHMLDVVEPGEYFSVIDYTNMTLKIIEEIFSRGNIPIIVGGTGFYIDSILYEYNLPVVPNNFELRIELEKMSLEELYLELEKLDRKYAQEHNTKEHRNNKHRMMRAIEIAKSIGHVPELKKESRFKGEEYKVEIIHTNVNRVDLKQRIQNRLLKRIEDGMTQEIQNVKEKYNLSFEYLTSLGLEFKWVSMYLQEKISHTEMVENLVKDIYAYARRQETWFKRYKN